MEADLAAVNIAPSNPTVSSENTASSKLTRLPLAENVTPWKLTVPPENTAR